MAKSSFKSSSHRSSRRVLALHGDDSRPVDRLLALRILGRRSHGNPCRTGLPVEPVECLLNRNAACVEYKMRDGEVIREDWRIAVRRRQIHRVLIFRESELLGRRVERQSQSAERVGLGIAVEIGK